MLKWSREGPRMKTLGAAKVKAHFLALVDDVERKREPVLVTKRGRPVMKMVPVDVEDDPLAIYRFGGFNIVGDIVAPATDPDDWECD